MASSEGKSLITACFLGRSKAQMSVGKILDTIYTAAPPPNLRRHVEGFGGESLVGRNVGRRVLLNFDLNVAPPEEPDSDADAYGGGNGEETLPFLLPLRPPPPAEDVPDVSGEKVGLCDEREPKLNGVVDEEVCVDVESEPEMEERERRYRRWIGLLEIAENELSEIREEEETRIRNRKRRASQEAELGDGATTRAKISGQRRQSLVAKWNGEVAAAAAEAVVRSTRGTMPNKYRDSVLGAVAELPRHNKNGKSATVWSTKRKSR